MVTLRPAAERGHFDHGWLDTWHTFSFADYRDPRHMNFRALRVINEDRVRGGKGFPTHAHQDMEIVTYVLEGALQHRDSLGTGSIIRPDDVQRMSAGTGVTHSEFNASPDEPVHLLQIWIVPERTGLPPSYEQRTFPREEKRSALRLVASPEGRDGAVTIHQDAELYVTVLKDGESVQHALARGRGAWVQIARGAATLNGVAMEAGDGAAVTDEPLLDLRADGEVEALVFDLG
jgi:redox-sensitive bicupin YhaK (pirin superfamily)